MSEWIRHRGSKYMPKCLEGKRFEVRFRNGSTTGSDDYISDWEHEQHSRDVMAYRIINQEPATPDYTNGYPVGTTSKDIGAKVGDEFVVVSNESTASLGTIVTLMEDDGSTNPFFYEASGKSRYISWFKLAPLPPKSAIELQAEEVGIVDQEWPEDRIDVVGQNGNDGLHYQIDTSPERVEIEQENVRITPETLTLRDIAPALKAAGVTIKLEDDPRTAPDFLQSALQTLTQRGKDYDKPEGERSAEAVAVAFNAITGRNLTEAEVWLVLQLVKDVRQWQNPGRYHADSALDCVAYAALKAEALAASGK